MKTSKPLETYKSLSAEMHGAASVGKGKFKFKNKMYTLSVAYLTLEQLAIRLDLPPLSIGIAAKIKM